MSNHPSKQGLNIRLAPQMPKGHRGKINSLLIKVVRGEGDEAILEHTIDITGKQPHEIDEEFQVVIERAVLSKILPVGIKTRLVNQFRQNYCDLLRF